MLGRSVSGSGSYNFGSLTGSELDDIFGVNDMNAMVNMDIQAQQNAYYGVGGLQEVSPERVPEPAVNVPPRTAATEFNPARDLNLVNGGGSGSGSAMGTVAPASTKPVVEVKLDAYGHPINK